MGYETERTLRLEFGEGEESAFVRVRSSTFAEWKAIVEDLQAGSAERMADTFVRALIEWNFEFRGEPIPLTREGLDSMDPNLRKLVLDEWLNVLRGGAENHPLGKKSNSGDSERSMKPEDL